MYINQDTKLYGILAGKPSSFECKLFNISFRFYNLNAIYKSFGIHDIKLGVEAAWVFNIKGFAIGSPYKIEVVDCVDHLSNEVKEIGAANVAIKQNDGKYKVYNTEFMAATDYLNNFSNRPLVILGNGAYAAAVKYAATVLNMEVTQIARENWEDIHFVEDHVIFNCTPIENIKVNDTNIYIDNSLKTKTGMILTMLQTSHQFKLYTGFSFPMAIG